MDESQKQHLEEGMRLFYERQYFECHEVLEDLWREQKDPERQFTQGVIQAAVGLYHLERGNTIGAQKLFARALARLRPFCPTYRGYDVAALCEMIESK